MIPILRREFIWRMASVLSLPYVGGTVLGCGDAASEPARPARPETTAADYTSRAPLAAEVLGKSYLAERAPDLDPSQIEILLAPIESLILQADSESDAIERLQAAVRQDFLELRIHRLEGWTLSQTELAVCAFVALDAQTRHGEG